MVERARRRQSRAPDARDQIAARVALCARLSRRNRRRVAVPNYFDVACAARVDRVIRALRSVERLARLAFDHVRSRARGLAQNRRTLSRGSHLRRTLGVLELLGARALDLHRALFRPSQTLRDARPRLSRLSAVRARMLGALRLRAFALG